MTLAAGRTQRPEFHAQALERWLVAMSLVYVVALVAALFALFPREPSGQAHESVGAQASSQWPQGEEARSSSAQGEGPAMPALGSQALDSAHLRSDAGGAEGELATYAPGTSAPEAMPSTKASLAAPVQVTKCWTTDGTEMSRVDCDTPPFFPPWVDTLYETVEACRLSVQGESSRGILLLGVEADLLRGRSSAWSEPGSTVDGAVDIVECLRPRMPAPPKGAMGQWVRYQLALSFVLPAPRPVPLPGTGSAVALTEEKGEAAPSGELAVVTSEKVRVRKQPTENGEIIGRISPPAQVLVLERKDQWCRVLTPNRNEGWMVCWALGPSPSKP